MRKKHVPIASVPLCDVPVVVDKRRLPKTPEARRACAGARAGISGYTLEHTPQYELVEATATREHVQNVGMHVVAGCDNYDGIRAIWRCPACGYAMSIGNVGRVGFNCILTVSLRCDNQHCGRYEEKEEEVST